jgi:hypothetical protein
MQTLNIHSINSTKTNKVWALIEIDRLSLSNKVGALIEIDRLSLTNKFKAFESNKVVICL